MKALALLLLPSLLVAELPDIQSVPPDLVVPALSEGTPAAGKRVRHGLNTLCLPTDWKPDTCLEGWTVMVSREVFCIRS